jgi:hypothetical protein
MPESSEAPPSAGSGQSYARASIGIWTVNTSIASSKMVRSDCLPLLSLPNTPTSS